MTESQKFEPIAKKQSKTEVINSIAEATGASKADISAMFDHLALLAKRHMVTGGSGEFTIPEVGIKLKRAERGARTARNPQTGEPVDVPAKTAIKAVAMKAAKDMLSS